MGGQDDRLIDLNQRQSTGVGYHLFVSCESSASESEGEPLIGLAPVLYAAVMQIPSPRT